MKISELTELTEITGNEYAVVIANGTTYKVLTSRLGGGQSPPVASSFLPGSPSAVFGPSAIRSDYAGSSHTISQNLITWHDQSGNEYDVVASSAGVTWANGVVFDGASNLSRPIFSTKDAGFSIYVLAQPLSPSRGQLVVNGSVSASPNTGWAVGFGSSTHDDRGSRYIGLIQSVAWTGGVDYSTPSKVFSSVCKPNKAFFSAVDTGGLAQVSSAAQRPPNDAFIIGGAVALGSNRYLELGNKIKAVAYYDYDTQLADEHEGIVEYLSTL